MFLNEVTQNPKKNIGKIADKNKTKKSGNFNQWITELDKNKLSLWRESLAQLRQLHGDVWNGVRFFLTVNGIIIAAIFALFRFDWTNITGFIIASLAGIGIFLSILADKILIKHRGYYLEMLLRKTLLEIKLGFYNAHLNGIDLSFPWKVPKKYINEVITNPSLWMKEQMWREKTISRLLRMTYWFFIMLYIIAFIVVILNFQTGYFIT